MGTTLLDKYSLLHFATGVIAFHWSVPLLYWFLAHGGFELVENTQEGMKFINEITLWPGGKNRADTVTNMFGDHVCAMAGWFVASQLGQHDQE